MKYDDLIGYNMTSHATPVKNHSANMDTSAAEVAPAEETKEAPEIITAIPPTPEPIVVEPVVEPKAEKKTAEKTVASDEIELSRGAIIAIIITVLLIIAASIAAALLITTPAFTLPDHLPFGNIFAPASGSSNMWNLFGVHKPSRVASLARSGKKIAVVAGIVLVSALVVAGIVGAVVYFSVFGGDIVLFGEKPVIVAPIDPQQEPSSGSINFDFAETVRPVGSFFTKTVFPWLGDLFINHPFAFLFVIFTLMMFFVSKGAAVMGLSILAMYAIYVSFASIMAAVYMVVTYLGLILVVRFVLWVAGDDEETRKSLIFRGFARTFNFIVEHTICSFLDTLWFFGKRRLIRLVRHCGRFIRKRLGKQVDKEEPLPPNVVGKNEHCALSKWLLVDLDSSPQEEPVV